MKNLQILLICILIILTSCGKNAQQIYYNLNIQDLSIKAQKENKPFCLVLIDDSSFAGKKYKECVKEEGARIFGESIINFVDVNKSENFWYRQWLSTTDSVVTCVFSSSFVLNSIIGGASSYSFKYIQEVVGGRANNLDFGYRRIFECPDSVQIMPLLNDILKCKIMLDNDTDFATLIDETLKSVQYPYNIYLKFLNNIRYGRNASVEASRLLEFDNVYYMKLYGELFKYAEKIANPNIDINDKPRLFLENEEIVLDNCKEGQSEYFDVKLTNTGYSVLSIRNIDLGCSCIKLLSDVTKEIKPGSSDFLRFEFFPDKKGVIEREITIVSNAISSFDIIKVRAVVK